VTEDDDIVIVGELKNVTQEVSKGVAKKKKLRKC